MHPTRRVPVNATLLVARVSLALGLYMSSRDDGITLLSTLVNFGALTAFLLLHVSVVVHFVVRRKSRDWWRHLVVPVHRVRDPALRDHQRATSPPSGSASSGWRIGVVAAGLPAGHAAASPELAPRTELA